MFESGKVEGKLALRDIHIPKKGVGTSASPKVAALLTPEYGGVPPLLIS